MPLPFSYLVWVLDRYIDFRFQVGESMEARLWSVLRETSAENGGSEGSLLETCSCVSLGGIYILETPGFDKPQSWG
jgi:hypothetical protein